MQTTAKIDPKGGAITVQLTFGFASVGSYEATLYDTNDQNGNTFQTGASTDPTPEVVTLPEAAAALAGRLLLIDAALVPPDPPDVVGLTAAVFQGSVALASLDARAEVSSGQKATPMLFFRFTT